MVIDDGNGYRSIYAHLGRAAVEKGDLVRAGDLIGWEGASGNATGCHLHYALFSPLEDATLVLDPKVAKKTRLPPARSPGSTRCSSCRRPPRPRSPGAGAPASRGAPLRIRLAGSAGR